MAEEFIRILDELGNPTSKVVSKQEIHKGGYWHEDIHLFIANESREVLLQFRSPEKTFYPGCWHLSVAGHTPVGIAPAVNVVKELDEELGISIDPERLFFYGTEKVISPVISKDPSYHKYNNTFLHMYILQMASTEVDLDSLQLEEGKVEKVKWYPLAKLKAEFEASEDYKSIHADDGLPYLPHPKEYWLKYVAAIEEFLESLE